MRLIRGNSLWVDYENLDGAIPETMTGFWEIKDNGDALVATGAMVVNLSNFEMRIAGSVIEALAYGNYILQVWVEEADGYKEAIEAFELNIVQL